MTLTRITDAQLLFMAKSMPGELKFDEKPEAQKIGCHSTQVDQDIRVEVALSSDLFDFNWKEFGVFVNKVSRNEFRKLKNLSPDWTREVGNSNREKVFEMHFL